MQWDGITQTSDVVFPILTYFRGNEHTFSRRILWEGCDPMFIVTARIPKKRLIAGGAVLASCAVILLAALILSGGRAAAASAEVGRIRSSEDRTAYLNSLGWTAEARPVKTEELLVPEEFDESYADYLALQEEQGFDLNQYRGRRVKRYTYQLTNYPGREDMTASLLVYKNRIIGGQIQSADGTILHGLRMPAKRDAGLS